MSLAAYQPYLEKASDITARTQSYRVDHLEEGWCVKVCGHYMVAVDTREEAQRWLAGFLLAASTVETSTSEVTPQTPPGTPLAHPGKTSPRTGAKRRKRCSLCARLRYDRSRLPTCPQCRATLRSPEKGGSP